MLQTLMMYFQYPFVRYAFIVGILIALCSALFGVTLVLKRFSFIGDGLSHVAFGAIAIASVLNLTNRMLLVLPLTILCAVLLLWTGQNAKIKGDAAIAMISAGALAFGYLIMNVFSSSTNLSGDVCSTLFGSTSILTLSQSDVILCVVLSVIVVVLFLLFYNKLFAITFDETFSRAVGVNTDRYNLFIAVVIAVIIVLAMNLVGSLLISALIVFPALSAMRLFHSFKAVTIAAAVISVICAVAGLVTSILAGTPVGSTIVMMDVLAFLICYMIGKIRGSRSVLALLTGCLLLTACGGNATAKSNTAATNSVESVIVQKIAEEKGEVVVKSPEAIDWSDIPEPEEVPDEAVLSTTEGIDIDLTILSSTLVYSEVYRMMFYPEEYAGKVIRMQGMYTDYEDPDSGAHYEACIISDATACCSQGVEFQLTKDYVYPDDYPTFGEDVTVTGTFSTYLEDGETYATLTDAVLED